MVLNSNFYFRISCNYENDLLSLPWPVWSFILDSSDNINVHCIALILAPLDLTCMFSGKVSILEDAALDSFHTQINQQGVGDSGDSKMNLTTSDVYKELRLRGYDYGKTFQGILESNNAGNRDAYLCVWCFWNLIFCCISVFL